jgi:hypothetical protein
MTTELTVCTKIEYGQRRIYPICEKSHIFVKIAGTRTFGESTIRMIKELGYSFKVQQEQVSL